MTMAKNRRTRRPPPSNAKAENRQRVLKRAPKKRTTRSQQRKTRREEGSSLEGGRLSDSKIATYIEHFPTILEELIEFQTNEWEEEREVPYMRAFYKLVYPDYEAEASLTDPRFRRALLNFYNREPLSERSAVDMLSYAEPLLKCFTFQIRDVYASTVPLTRGKDQATLYIYNNRYEPFVVPYDKQSSSYGWKYGMPKSAKLEIIHDAYKYTVRIDDFDRVMQLGKYYVKVSGVQAEVDSVGPASGTPIGDTVWHAFVAVSCNMSPEFKDKVVRAHEKAFGKPPVGVSAVTEP